MKNEKVKNGSEFRQDPISGDWVLLAPAIGAGHEFRERIKADLPKDKCPFENPAKFDNAPPVLVYQNDAGDDWFLQIIPNKYPAVESRDIKSTITGEAFESQAGVGFHEIVIYRDHNRYLADFSREEIKRVLSAFQERYKSLAQESFIKYISIFHNHGKEAGSTVPHPHSQILALPILPPDISRDIDGSRRYFHEHGQCAHCHMLDQEIKDGTRIIYQNEQMIVIAPFASKAEAEVRIFPKKHFAYFEKAGEEELIQLADAMKFTFSRIFEKLNDPAFNFFIHTAPTGDSDNHEHYHWHMEILPKFDIIGGFELGTGLDIIAMAPEKAAEILRK